MEHAQYIPNRIFSNCFLICSIENSSLAPGILRLHRFESLCLIDTKYAHFLYFSIETTYEI